jgi:hypothetical protein
LQRSALLNAHTQPPWSGPPKARRRCPLGTGRHGNTFRRDALRSILELRQLCAQHRQRLATPHRRPQGAGAQRLKQLCIPPVLLAKSRAGAIRHLGWMPLRRRPGALAYVAVQHRRACECQGRSCPCICLPPFVVDAGRHKGCCALRAVVAMPHLAVYSIVSPIVRATTDDDPIGGT